MRSSTVVWTNESLAAFVRKPDTVIAGTSMRFYGWRYDNRRIEDLLAYLRATSPGPP